MSKKPRQMVERTAKGAVRFTLGQNAQMALKELVQDAANRPKPMTFKTLPLVMMAAVRMSAQEILTKRAFLVMPLVAEFSFTLHESEALMLLVILWQVDVSGDHDLTYLFGCLHQVLC